MLKRAVRWEYLGRDPVGVWPISKEASFRRSRFLAPDEIPTVLAACDESRSPYLKAFVLVALNTGMRRGEILSLTRKSVDWQNQVATLEDTKNGETRHVPLNDTAIAALRSLPVRLDGRLFPFKDGHCVTRAFRRAVKRAGIEDFRLHDLRHTFASHHAMQGLQGRGLQALLGHKDPRMTMRYSHLSDTYLKAAVNAVNLGSAAANESKDGTYVAPGR
jgi:integrase